MRAQAALEPARKADPSAGAPPWFITEAAARQYDALMLGDGSPESLAEARQDLEACSKTAHYLREQERGYQLWRAGKEWFRLRLVVARKDAMAVGWRRPALIAVRTPYDGWIYQGEKK
jgi:hypothetical protein